MLKHLLLMLVALFALMLTPVTSYSQAVVFNDDFSMSGNGWYMARSGSDYGAYFINNQLQVTNNASGAINTTGWVMAAIATAEFDSPYNSVLASNPGLITWTFNMRQSRSNPSGFNSGEYGSAFILAGTSGTTNVAGTGYAVMLGNAGSTDPIRLVRYNSGIRNFTNLITSQTSGLTDFGNQHVSVKVTYQPATHTWQLFLRNDGSAFADPSVGNYPLQGTVVNNTYTSQALQLMGGFQSSGFLYTQTSNYDNVRVALDLPELISINPSSRIAGGAGFNLVVTGKNFNQQSTVRWNGENRPTTYNSAGQLTAAIPAGDIALPGTAAITVANQMAVSNSLPLTVDPSGVPSLSVTPNLLNNMVTVAGTASASQSYTITGQHLVGNATVTPPSNFQVSTNNINWSSGFELTPAQLSSGQTVYVRVAPGTIAGIYSGSVANTSQGASPRGVGVSASVYATEPTVQASAVTFTNVTSTTFTANFNSGNGAGRILVIRQGQAVNAGPVDGISYQASAVFGNGAEIGTGNFAAYSGSGNSVTVTGLTPGTTYHVAVYEFNGTAGTQNFLLTSPATGNRATLNAPLGWQIYSSNAVNTITFDATVDGVNTDVYQGDGVSQGASAGELNSNAWAFTGFSDGALNFSGTNNEGGDYDRGDSEGGEDTPGLYAFNTSSGAPNYGLGIQQGAGDFAPGTVTLRFQNQSGAVINSINIGYKVYVYNDQPGSSSFNFSHSASTGSFTAVPGLDVVTPAAADAVPGWKAYYRVVTITGLNISANSYYYLRWAGAAVSGSVYDEIALDDITLVANPTTNFAPFAGNAESFVLQGNASLSNDLAVSSNITFNTGGRLHIGNRTLSLGGTITNTASGGIRGGAASNLVINGPVNPQVSLDMTTPGTTNLLNNFSVATTASNTVTMLTPVAVNGTLLTSAGQTLNMGIHAISGTLSSIINNGTIATQNATAIALPSGKTWGGTGTVSYNAASAAQTIATGTYNNLRASSTGGSIAAGSFTVNGTLDLPSANPGAAAGSLSMGTHTLTMGPLATNIGIGDVTGIITRNSISANVIYTFGHQHTSIVFPAVGTLPASMSLKVTIGSVPAWRPGAIARHYDLIQTGALATKATIKAHYKDSELNGNNENKLVDWAHIVSSGSTLEQGRSNYNLNENWVELSNVNVALYFQPTFGAVLLTLDESEAGSLTWNGSVSDSWTTAANWTPNATPSDGTIVYIPNAATTPNDPVLNPTGTVGYVNIEAGGILNGGTNTTINVNGSGGAWINNGTFNPGTSTVTFTNADATIAGSTDFYNITINSGASLRPVTGNIMRIGGSFINNGTMLTGVIENTVEYSGANQVLAAPNGALAAYHHLVISGTGAVFPASLNIRGDLTLNQGVDFSGKTLSMTGPDQQAIGGSADASFNNLTINKTSGGVQLATQATVAGTLTLTSGVLDLSNHNLTLGANPVAGNFSNSAMIVASGTGELRRTFTSTGSYLYPIGDKTGTAEYSPVTVFVNSGSFANAYIGVQVRDAVHPNNSSAGQNISRYWNLTQSGITGAVVTLTATYLASDITGTESGIWAAQLAGNFDVLTNPWVRFGALGSNSLVAPAVELPSGVISAFTGIKGGEFTAEVTGYGEYCQDQPATLLAVPTGGEAPYSYQWSAGLGTLAEATPSTSAIGTVNYTVTVRDSNGITAMANADVTVLATSVGGTTSPNQNICMGETPADITLSGNVGQVVHWERAMDLNFTNPTIIANTTQVLTGASIGPLTESAYFRAVVSNGSCDEMYSAAVGVLIRSTTWNGTSWSDGEPEASIAVIFAGNYTAQDNLEACTITVQNNAAVVIPSDLNVTTYGAVTIQSGTFTLENNANLLQLTDAANSGNITVRRNSSALMRLDYTLWSSPVDGQNLLAFSPLTVATRFYTYNTVTNFYQTIVPSSNEFATGNGYLIRMPNNHPTVPTIWQGQFTGVPHNGPVEVPVISGAAGQRFNLVGNPYPSALSIDAFMLENASNITSSLYFWRKTNNPDAPSYVQWTGGTFTTNNPGLDVEDYLDMINVGQGFFVEAKEGAGAVSFNNQMRIPDNSNQFFRQVNDRSRIWLNVSGSAGAFSQSAIVYVDGASDDQVDYFDGRYINDGVIALTQRVGGVDFAIQGRAPWDITDVVALTFKATAAGSYTMAIGKVDGLFEGDQQIYLKDNLTGLTHNLKESAYGFTSAAGTFANRFEIVYMDSQLDNPQHGFDPAKIVVASQNGMITVDANSLILESIEVYDLRGRLVALKKAIQSTTASVETVQANQVLIARITTSDGHIVTRKVIN